MRSRAPPVGGCSEAEHPQRSKKSSKRAARRFFRAPQGGRGRCACGYLGSVSVRSTDDAFASFVSSTASDRKGFVKGESVPLDRVLPTFARTKVGPRREGVLTTPLQKAARRRRRSQTGPCRIGEIKPNHSLCRQSLRLISFATSLYTREAFGWCDAEGEKKLCCSLCWQPLSQPYGCQLPLHRGAFWLMRCRNLG